MFYLSENMRVMASENISLQNFDKWTVSIGNGTAIDALDMVDIPEELFFKIPPNTKNYIKAEEQATKLFCDKIYPQISENHTDPAWLHGGAILALTNKEVDTINDLMETRVPGRINYFSSSDELEGYEQVIRYNTEYLKKLCPSGFPHHLLSLKPGM